MHVAINGQFWSQPHTGSGQYLRHLWSALEGLAPGDRYTLLLPPGAHGEPPQPAGMCVKHGKPLSLLGGRSANLDKLLWEAWGAAREARGAGARRSVPAPVVAETDTVPLRQSARRRANLLEN